jgi:Na+-translocating ferredoxin:NAD+ oxidoreductase subunit G
VNIAATALRLGVLGAAVGAGLAGIDAMTHARIHANEQRGTLRTIVEVTGDMRLANLKGRSLPPLTICSTSDAPLYRVYARSARGYGGVIQLLLGIGPEGALTGVRVVSHRETAGIGDAIDAAKSSWIHSFDGITLADAALTADGGAIDAISGASVTSRGVVDGVHDALADAAGTPSGSCSNVIDE